MLNSILYGMEKIEIEENLLSKVIIIGEDGRKMDIKTYIKTLIIEALEEAVGGDKDERNS